MQWVGWMGFLSPEGITTEIYLKSFNLTPTQVSSGRFPHRLYASPASLESEFADSHLLQDKAMICSSARQSASLLPDLNKFSSPPTNNKLSRD